MGRPRGRRRWIPALASGPAGNPVEWGAGPNCHLSIGCSRSAGASSDPGWCGSRSARDVVTAPHDAHAVLLQLSQPEAEDRGAGPRHPRPEQHRREFRHLGKGRVEAAGRYHAAGQPAAARSRKRGRLRVVSGGRARSRGRGESESGPRSRSPPEPRRVRQRRARPARRARRALDAAGRRSRPRLRQYRREL